MMAVRERAQYSHTCSQVNRLKGRGWCAPHTVISSLISESGSHFGFHDQKNISVHQTIYMVVCVCVYTKNVLLVRTC